MCGDVGWCVVMEVCVVARGSVMACVVCGGERSALAIDQFRDLRLVEYRFQEGGATTAEALI